MTHFEIQRKTHVGLLVVVHRLDKKNEITKVITHCKTGKTILFSSTNSAYSKQDKKKNKSLTKHKLC